ncbi:uncharacterized protein BDR25DRAFT_362039 [Lindgomyces ingoldianus]|uniref:Uncharacterized protein n=1 Tax=Lindgomyces ingoldianus TaxID=673940 RepID=A0ACB6QB01_9PLEO|nr:uncharacterized protein BDR25DRAFT_362039 [Lindgomyces ingoldianus]KAF2464109.1 hypothetical protein BDR25DRAFT_362039 [Lindgomyces ingoldianus]
MASFYRQRPNFYATPTLAELSRAVFAISNGTAFSILSQLKPLVLAVNRGPFSRLELATGHLGGIGLRNTRSLSFTEGKRYRFQMQLYWIESFPKEIVCQAILEAPLVLFRHRKRGIREPLITQIWSYFLYLIKPLSYRAYLGKTAKQLRTFLPQKQQQTPNPNPNYLITLSIFHRNNPLSKTIGLLPTITSRLGQSIQCLEFPPYPFPWKLI